MQSSARDSYLEAQVLTASPQRLRLLLLEAALRFTRQLEQAIADGRTGDAVLCGDRARQIVAELLGGIQRDDSELARRVFALYVYLYQRLTSAPLCQSAVEMADVLELLEYECETWRLLCEQTSAAAPAPLTANDAPASLSGSLVLDA